MKLRSRAACLDVMSTTWLCHHSVSKIVNFGTFSDHFHCRDISIGCEHVYHKNILRKPNGSAPRGLELHGMEKTCRFGAPFLGSVNTRRLDIGLGVGCGINLTL